MKTPITYYGGKQTMLKHILPLIPQHTIYTECFAGGAALFFAKRPVATDVINDLNGELVNFYRTIVSDFDALRAEIERTIHSRFQHEVAWFIYNHSDYFTNVQRAWAVWVLSKLGFAGQMSSSFGFDFEGRQSRKIGNAKEQFTDELRQRLANTTIERDDAYNVVRRYDTPDTFHFIDPPYVSTNSGHYADMFDDADLERLLQLCELLKGKFMLTMFPNNTIKAYADKNGWVIHSIERQITACRDNRRRQEEWMVCNYNQPMQQQSLDLFQD